MGPAARKAQVQRKRTERRAREVVEETRHRVRVREFLGAITYRARGRPKVVQFWRMQAEVKASRDVMEDIMAVEWLPLAAAARRLSYPLEKLFLRSVGRALRHRRHRLKRKGRPAPKGKPRHRAAKSRANKSRSRRVTTTRHRARKISGHSAVRAGQPTILQRVSDGFRNRRTSLRPRCQNLMPAEHPGRNSKRPIHGAFKMTAATSHAQQARFAMTITPKTFTVLAAATTLGLAAFVTAQPAQAHHNHRKTFTGANARDVNNSR